MGLNKMSFGVWNIPTTPNHCSFYRHIFFQYFTLKITTWQEFKEKKMENWLGWFERDNFLKSQSFECIVPSCLLLRKDKKFWPCGMRYHWWHAFRIQKPLVIPYCVPFLLLVYRLRWYLSVEPTAPCLFVSCCVFCYDVHGLLAFWSYK